MKMKVKFIDALRQGDISSVDEFVQLCDLEGGKVVTLLALTHYDELLQL